jgi:hypothetical protein
MQSKGNFGRKENYIQDQPIEGEKEREREILHQCSLDRLRGLTHTMRRTKELTSNTGTVTRPYPGHHRGDGAQQYAIAIIGVFHCTSPYIGKSKGSAGQKRLLRAKMKKSHKGAQKNIPNHLKLLSKSVVVFLAKQNSQPQIRLK